MPDVKEDVSSATLSGESSVENIDESVNNDENPSVAESTNDTDIDTTSTDDSSSLPRASLSPDALRRREHERGYVCEQMEDFGENPDPNGVAINADWWSMWAAYVGLHDSLQSATTTPPPRPAAIDNTPLLSHPGPRPLEQGSGYVVVPKSMWDSLIIWYGGGPVVSTSRLERTLPLSEKVERKLSKQATLGDGDSDLLHRLPRRPGRSASDDSTDDDDDDDHANQHIGSALVSIAGNADEDDEKDLSLYVSNLERLSPTPTQLRARPPSPESAAHDSGTRVLYEVTPTGIKSTTAKGTTSTVATITNNKGGVNYEDDDTFFNMLNNDGLGMADAPESSTTASATATGGSFAAAGTSTVSTPDDDGGVFGGMFNEAPSTAPLAITYTSSYRGGSWSRYRDERAPNGASPGLCGLRNLGNTCYMNAALQCISHVPPVTALLTSDDFLQDLNTDNPLGHDGDIAHEMSKLLRRTWSGQFSCVVPKTLKDAIGKHKSDFAGYGQQDSQELLSFVLDGLHEDLNRIKKKPYVENVDSDDPKWIDNLSEMADESWTRHRLRHDSIIADTFLGMFKSTVRCSKCAKSSVKFEPFMQVSAPIPVSNQVILSVTWVPPSLADEPRRFQLSVNKNAEILVLRDLIAACVGRPSSHILIADVYHHYIYATLEEHSLIRNINEPFEPFAFLLAADADEHHRRQYEKLTSRANDSFPPVPPPRPQPLDATAPVSLDDLTASSVESVTDSTSTETTTTTRVDTFEMSESLGNNASTVRGGLQALAEEDEEDDEPPLTVVGTAVAMTSTGVVSSSDAGLDGPLPLEMLSLRDAAVAEATANVTRELDQYLVAGEFDPNHESYFDEKQLYEADSDDASSMHGFGGASDSDSDDSSMDECPVAGLTGSHPGALNSHSYALSNPLQFDHESSDDDNDEEDGDAAEPLVKPWRSGGGAAERVPLVQADATASDDDDVFEDDEDGDGVGTGDRRTQQRNVSIEGELDSDSAVHGDSSDDDDTDARSSSSMTIRYNLEEVEAASRAAAAMVPREYLCSVCRLGRPASELLEHPSCGGILCQTCQASHFSEEASMEGSLDRVSCAMCREELIHDTLVPFQPPFSSSMDTSSSSDGEGGRHGSSSTEAMENDDDDDDDQDDDDSERGLPIIGPGLPTHLSFAAVAAQNVAQSSAATTTTTTTTSSMMARQTGGRNPFAVTFEDDPVDNYSRAVAKRGGVTRRMDSDSESVVDVPDISPDELALIMDENSLRCVPVYFSESSFPQPTGRPNVLSWVGPMTAANIWRAVRACIDGLVPDTRFRVLHSDTYGSSCGTCSRSSSCRGCPIVDEATPFAMGNDDSVVIEWASRKISERMRKIVVDVEGVFPPPKSGEKTEEEGGSEEEAEVLEEEEDEDDDDDADPITPRYTSSWSSSGYRNGYGWREPDRPPVQLKRCLKAFTEEETLSDTECWYCPQCKEHQDATKQMEIWRAPPVLVVHLKRFLYESGARVRIGEKIEENVQFPLRSLDFGPYLSDGSPYRDSAVYECFGVVNHSGSLGSGHYTAYCKRGKRWYMFDDSRTYRVAASEVVSPRAYVLFFRRKETAWDMGEISRRLIAPESSASDDEQEDELEAKKRSIQVLVPVSQQIVSLPRAGESNSSASASVDEGVCLKSQGTAVDVVPEPRESDGEGDGDDSPGKEETEETEDEEASEAAETRDEEASEAAETRDEEASEAAETEDEEASEAAETEEVEEPTTNDDRGHLC